MGDRGDMGDLDARKNGRKELVGLVGDQINFTVSRWFLQNFENRVLSRQGHQMRVFNIHDVFIRLHWFSGQKRLDLPHFIYAN